MRQHDKNARIHGQAARAKGAICGHRAHCLHRRRSESERPMTLKDRLSENLKQAMKSRDARRVSTLRLALAAIQDREIRSDAPAAGLSDDDIVAVLVKMVKQREESASTYDSAARPELAAAEREEITIIREFMPRQMAEEEIRTAVREAIISTGAAGPKDMGKVMGALKQRHAGTIDMAKAGAVAKELLATPKS